MAEQMTPQTAVVTTAVTKSNLAPEKLERYQSINRSLVVTDMNSISNYGSELSTIMSQNSDELLKAVRTDNGGEVAKLTSELLGQLELIDIDELSDQRTWKTFMRRLPILKNFVPSIAQVLNKYDNIEETVTKISDKIKTVSLVSKKDNTALEQIFQNDVKYIEQIKELIEAAQLKHEEVTNQLYHMQEHTDDYETYEINDVANFANALEKKISDMGQVQYAMKMNLMQIRACQQNNNLIANKADTFVSTVLPVWKTQLSVSIMLERNKKNAEAVKEMSDTTNRIIEKNAELLRMNSVATAKEAERGIFDAQSLQKSTDLMIQTINEVNAIHDKASEQRKQFAESIVKMENQMHDAMENVLKNHQSQYNYLEGDTKILKEFS